MKKMLLLYKKQFGPYVSNALVEVFLAAYESLKTVSPAINPAVLYGSFNANEMTSDRLLDKSSIMVLQLPKRHNISFYKGHRSELNKDSSLGFGWIRSIY